MCLVVVGEVCDQGMASQHQLSDWSHLSGHSQRPVVSTSSCASWSTSQSLSPSLTYPLPSPHNHPLSLSYLPPPSSSQPSSLPFLLTPSLLLTTFLSPSLTYPLPSPDNLPLSPSLLPSLPPSSPPPSGLQL